MKKTRYAQHNQGCRWKVPATTHKLPTIMYPLIYTAKAMNKNLLRNVDDFGADDQGGGAHKK
eukprot:6459390-Amphidinium_carterae.1